MDTTWLAGGAFDAPAEAVRTAGVWHTPDAGVRVVRGTGATHAVVAGVFRGGDAEVARVADAVAAGCVEEITSMGGSYWMAVHDGDRRRTVVAGDLAESRAVFTAVTGRGPVWATDAALLADRLARMPDLELLAARIAVGSAEHWPRRSVWTGIERVPGGHAVVWEDGVTRTVGPVARIGAILRDQWRLCHQTTNRPKPVVPAAYPAPRRAPSPSLRALLAKTCNHFLGGWGDTDSRPSLDSLMATLLSDSMDTDGSSGALSAECLPAGPRGPVRTNRFSCKGSWPG